MLLLIHDALRGGVVARRGYRLPSPQSGSLRLGPVTAKLCKVAIGGWSLQRSASRSRQFGQLTPKADFSAVLRALAAREGIVSFEGAIVLDA